jgi:glycosyltransferase involved in cell wall biosynthesis
MAPDSAALRTLFLNHTTVPGGAELSLVRMLRAHDHWNAVVLLARPGTPGLGAFADVPAHIPVLIAGVVQRYGASSAGSSTQAANAVRLAAQAVSTRLHPVFRTADVVVANTTRSAAYGALAACASRIPFVVHIRDLVDPEAIGGSGAAIMERIVLPRAHGVIADTERALDSARPFTRRDAVLRVVPSASGIVRRARRTRSSAPLRIGMLARIDPWKGQELLLEAFAGAFPVGDQRLELAGGAPFGHEDFAAHLRRRAVDLGVSDRLDLRGHVSDVDALLDQWDIAVQASLRAEPLGQNVLQYLAAGCATIVADEGGPTEWVRPEVNGLHFTARDPASLAAALRRLADDVTLRDRLGGVASVTPQLMTDAQAAAAHRDVYLEAARLTRR